MSSLLGIDYEVGDLVIVMHHIDWIFFSVISGELAFVVEIYDQNEIPSEIYDLKIRTLFGGEIGVWFGEVRKLEYDEDE